jgi:hypothetical protein
MQIDKQLKTKRINIRITPTDHEWLFDFAKKSRTTVSKLFAKYVDYLRKNADGNSDVRQS